MPSQINSQACSDNYTDAATILGFYKSGGGVFAITGADVFYELNAAKFGEGDTWTPEARLGSGGGTIPPGVSGIRFRNAIAGSIATVSALIRPPEQPYLSLAFPIIGSGSGVTGTFDGAGNITSGSGFTVVRLGAGQYTVTFTPAFGTPPNVQATSLGAGVGGNFAQITAPTALSVFIRTISDAGALVDVGVSFLATPTV